MTGDTLLNLYPAKILGLQDLDDHLVSPLQGDRDQLRQDVYGAGGSLDAKAVITVTGDELTLSADVQGYTPLGKRLLLDASESEWISTPFEDSGATVYSVGARHIDVPAGAQDRDRRPAPLLPTPSSGWGSSCRRRRWRWTAAGACC